MKALGDIIGTIGLEVHIQLKTVSKLFCGCPTTASAPNQALCPTCLGLPGGKPVLNKKALDCALKLATALNCIIPKVSYFSRKTYFYPDLVKNYQITQFEYPLAEKGIIQVKGKPITIRRIQLEEDPGSLIHDNGIEQSEYVFIDYNRSGIPLIELVTDPVFTSSAEVYEFLQKLISILEYIDIYDPKNFTVRVDANVSIEKGQRVEIKNITGFKAIRQAIDFEIIRQRDLLAHNLQIDHETRHYDQETGNTITLRKKETEEEYGYIFDPDLPKIVIDDRYHEEIRKQMPELAEQRAKRLSQQYAISIYNATILTSEKALADMFEEIIKTINKDIAIKWLIGPLKKIMNYNSLAVSETKLTAKHMVDFLTMVKEGEITSRMGDLLLRELVLHPQDPRIFAQKLNFKKVTNLEEVIDQVLLQHKQALDDVRNGKEKAFHFLLGEIMKLTGQKADIKKATELLKKKIIY